MKDSKGHLSVWRLLALLASLFNLVSLSGCVHVASLRVYPDDVPAGSLRLVQVINIGTREDIIKKVPEWYAAILASGIDDKDIVDGSVGVGRIFCCGGGAEKSERQGFFIPRGIDVKELDIVEIRAGQDPTEKPHGVVNTVTRVVQGSDSNGKACWWDPPKDYLWMRILYCEWMPKEGWILYNQELRKTWFKPPAAK